MNHSTLGSFRAAGTFVAPPLSRSRAHFHQAVKVVTTGIRYLLTSRSGVVRVAAGGASRRRGGRRQGHTSREEGGVEGGKGGCGGGGHPQGGGRGGRQAVLNGHLPPNSDPALGNRADERKVLP